MSNAARTLYHWRLDPFSRQVRLALAEKGLRARLVEERVWDGRQAFLALNPAGATPVLVADVTPRRDVVVGARAILEYLEETVPAPPLLPRSAGARAEARRLADWFDRKFDAEVNAFLLYELVEKPMTGQGPPDAEPLREGAARLAEHLAYVGRLADSRGWLGGEDYSLADIAALAHLSCVDTLGLVDWSQFSAAAGWRERATARPAFAVLADDHWGDVAGDEGAGPDEAGL